MHRFFLLDHSITVDHPVDLAPISHQLHSVLRLQPGETIGLLDGNGYLYSTEILSLARKVGTGRVLEKVLVDAEPQTHLTLYQCSLKADKFEWVLQKGTELGVSRFVPVIAERSIVRPASALSKKIPRWQKIIQEAAEQSGRGRLPTLAPPLSFDQAIEEATTDNHGLRILPWEEASAADSTAALSAILPKQDILPEDAILPKGAILPKHDDGNAHKHIALLIGPEGGLAEAEVEAARANGWQITSLGPRILRAETAAIATVAIIMNQLG